MKVGIVPKFKSIDEASAFIAHEASGLIMNPDTDRLLACHVAGAIGLSVFVHLVMENKDGKYSEEAKRILKTALDAEMGVIMGYIQSEENHESPKLKIASK